MIRKYLDTNILLDYPQIVTKNKDNECWVIPWEVLKEIDGLKRNKNPETAQKARKAAVYISKNMDNIDWDLALKNDGELVDDYLLRLVSSNIDNILVTNDVALKVFAEITEVPNEGYSWKEDYTGVRYVNLEGKTLEEYNEIVGKLMSEGICEIEDYEFSINEYLIVPPYEWLGAVVFKYNGEKFENVRGKEITNNWIGSIFPRNPEQICLVDALKCKVPIVYAGGKFGVGY